MKGISFTTTTTTPAGVRLLPLLAQSVSKFLSAQLQILVVSMMSQERKYRPPTLFHASQIYQNCPCSVWPGVCFVVETKRREEAIPWRLPARRYFCEADHVFVRMYRDSSKIRDALLYAFDYWVIPAKLLELATILPSLRVRICIYLTAK